MTEERLNELARKLGARAAERLDIDATARKVVERLREEPARPSIWMQQAWLRIAAALVLVVGGGFALRRVWPTGDSARHVAHYVADDLSDLSADELRDVLGAFDEIVAGDSLVVPENTTDLRELNAQQLRAVLRTLEG